MQAFIISVPGVTTHHLAGDHISVGVKVVVGSEITKAEVVVDLGVSQKVMVGLEVIQKVMDVVGSEVVVDSEVIRKVEVVVGSEVIQKVEVVVDSEVIEMEGWMEIEEIIRGVKILEEVAGEVKDILKVIKRITLVGGMILSQSLQSLLGSHPVIRLYIPHGKPVANENCSKPLFRTLLERRLHLMIKLPFASATFLSSYQCRDLNVKDKTVSRPSYV